MPVRKSKRQEKYAAKRRLTIERDLERTLAIQNADTALLVNMGFDTEISVKTIQMCRNDINAAIDKLLSADAQPTPSVSLARCITPPVSPARCIAVKCSPVLEPEFM